MATDHDDSVVIEEFGQQDVRAQIVPYYAEPVLAAASDTLCCAKPLSSAVLEKEPNGRVPSAVPHAQAQELLMMVVTAGLGGKLFLEAIPELSMMMNSMDRLLQVCMTQSLSRGRGCCWRTFVVLGVCAG